MNFKYKTLIITILILLFTNTQAKEVKTGKFLGAKFLNGFIIVF